MLQMPPSSAERHLRLLRYLILNAVLGLAVGIAISSLLILTDAGGLKDLIANDRQPYVVLFLLHAVWALMGVSAFVSVAVMSIPLDAKDGRNGSGDSH